MLEGMTMGVIISGSLIGLVGFFMFLYGKREGQPLTLITGLVLGLIPMIMHAIVPMWIVSGALVGCVAVHRRYSGPTSVA
ncbi:MAG: hypothetical protein KDA31_01390 [Phycisphaerales bacterium]|nr:hypothetical protein [Phycisphaerales bacterium]MCB9836021.1 hypothetical protein [Phycisphaera sp.]